MTHSVEDIIIHCNGPPICIIKAPHGAALCMRVSGVENMDKKLVESYYMFIITVLDI